MPETQERAWWSDVEHLREPLERRRAARTPSPGDGGRRTVRIRGQAVPGAPSRRLRVADDESIEPVRTVTRARRPAPRPIERLGGRPDRLAAWAVGGGLLLAIVAAISGHA